MPNILRTFTRAIPVSGNSFCQTRSRKLGVSLALWGGESQNSVRLDFPLDRLQGPRLLPTLRSALCSSPHHWPPLLSPLCPLPTLRALLFAITPAPRSALLWLFCPHFSPSFAVLRSALPPFCSALSTLMRSDCTLQCVLRIVP